MRTLFLTLSFMIAGMAVAQNGKQNPGKGKEATPQEKADKMTAKMKEELKLTEEQTAKIHQANLEFVTKNKELKDTTKEARALNREQHKAALKAILTPEQQEKAKEMMEEKQEKKEMKEKRAKKEKREKTKPSNQKKSK